MCSSAVCATRSTSHFRRSTCTRSGASAMSSAEPGSFGLRLALWYATLFVVGAIAIVFLTYYVTATSLAARDHQVIQSKLGAYAAVYSGGGFPALADTVRAEQLTAPERLYVRVMDPRRFRDAI